MASTRRFPRRPLSARTARCPLAESTDDPDDELLARLARDEPQAARELVARKLPRLLALAQRLLGVRAEAEEVAQESFMRAWQQAPRWRRGEARFDTWLHQVALNLCHDRLRRAERRRLVHPPPGQPDGDAPAFDAVDPGATPEQQLQSRELGQRVATAIAGLPPRQREALVLCHYQELPQADAARLMGVSVDALESLLARARRSLRERLREEGAP